mmetsp:Transcript_1433/g.3132  ORF Transcript_1433/g.3132 Transcript_1433/m.3132 type:complete len:307 (-) Transcript_1433:271-1191(-)
MDTGWTEMEAAWEIPAGFCLKVCRELLQDRRFAPLTTTFLEADCGTSGEGGLGCVEATQQPHSSDCSTNRSRSCSAVVQSVDFRLKQEIGQQAPGMADAQLVISSDGSVEMQCEGGELASTAQHEQAYPKSRRKRLQRRGWDRRSQDLWALASNPRYFHVTFLSPGSVAEQGGVMDGAASLCCNGLRNDLTLWDFVQTLDMIGFKGQYNYVYLPPSIDSLGTGFAFINFVHNGVARSFEHLVLNQEWPTVSSDSRRIRCRLAAKQGYLAYVSLKNIRHVLRLTNRRLWPLMATQDGSRSILAPWQA